jgi:hypothetical protein
VAQTGKPNEHVSDQKQERIDSAWREVLMIGVDVPSCPGPGIVRARRRSRDSISSTILGARDTRSATQGSLLVVLMASEGIIQEEGNSC